MSLISMVFLLLLSCSGLLVISVLNLEQRRGNKVGLECDLLHHPTGHCTHRTSDHDACSQKTDSSFQNTPIF